MDFSMGENERLAILYGYALLDTVPEACFDRLTRLAASVLGTPISLISLIDKDRQWFKSRHGIDVPETERKIAFCSHAIDSKDMLVVHDAHASPQFRDNPLVKGQPGIRFYAGAPLFGRDGAALGTLCVIDTVPRPVFDQRQQQILRDLADTVMEMFEMRLAIKTALERLP
jgi:GAF domain-containing protein